MNFFLIADPLKTPLDWNTRLQIAIGVAAALVCYKGKALYSLNIPCSILDMI